MHIADLLLNMFILHLCHYFKHLAAGSHVPVFALLLPFQNAVHSQESFVFPGSLGGLARLGRLQFVELVKQLKLQVVAVD